MTIPYCVEHVPYVSTSQMVEVDRLMIEEYRIEFMQMMENAGRNLAHLARVRFLDGDPRGKKVAVAAGSGGNGGGAHPGTGRPLRSGCEVGHCLRPGDPSDGDDDACPAEAGPRVAGRRRLRG